MLCTPVHACTVVYASATCSQLFKPLKFFVPGNCTMVAHACVVYASTISSRLLQHSNFFMPGSWYHRCKCSPFALSLDIDRSHTLHGLGKLLLRHICLCNICCTQLLRGQPHVHMHVRSVCLTITKVLTYVYGDIFMLISRLRAASGYRGSRYDA